ncbi:NAD-dependent epimerase/dehydratase family protein [Spirochaetota bacterium]
MEKYVVTGGAGFIGSHIVEELAQKKHRVIAFDNLHTGFKRNIEPLIKEYNVEFVEGSIMDQALLLKTLKGAESAFHTAALISVPESMEKQAEYVGVNTIGTLNVLKACRECGVKNIVLSSSAAIYGDNPVIPKKEDMLPEPKSPYAVTKLDGEYYFRMYRNEYGLNATSLRYFNVFGPRQDPASQYAAAVPIFIERACRNENISIFGNGEQTRDFIFVKDVVQANIKAAEKGGDVYNAAYGGKITINDLAKNIIKLTGSRSKIIYKPERPGDIKHSMADNSKITRELGFSPTSSLDDGLLETVRFFKDKITSDK